LPQDGELAFFEGHGVVAHGGLKLSAGFSGEGAVAAAAAAAAAASMTSVFALCLASALGSTDRIHFAEQNQNKIKTKSKYMFPREIMSILPGGGGAFTA
jgi:hypothetical protein